MTGCDGRQRSRLGVWVGFLALAAVLALGGSFADATGRTWLGYLLFLLASICVVAPVAARLRDRRR